MAVTKLLQRLREPPKGRRSGLPWRYRDELGMDQGSISAWLRNVKFGEGGLRKSKNLATYLNPAGVYQSKPRESG